ncbi:alpha/beta fold hydrolase [Occultella glacieicola]|uniref:Alpha/beta fold hydrolase n=1 Tax=Occultella glacieicola TaxID=2518684 RepID=A0ABY2E5P7_9MICO|nr:alpha/beta fold hydrolase [Occultella glacieicola]TDE95894.1 alpha/beta fold hydrolase [Occultella glacieicola]
MTADPATRSTAAREAAPGATILLVHGAWHGPWCWEEVAQRLGDLGNDVRTVQLRGHDGRPGRIRHGVHDYVEDVREAAAGCRPPLVVVGHSLGGLVAQKFLEHDRAAGLVLLAPTPVRGTLPAVARLARRYPVELLRATATLRMRPFVRTRPMVRDLFFTPRTDQELVDDTFIRLRDESYLAFLQTILVWPRPDRVRVPVLVVAAEQDRFFTLAEMQRTARAYGTRAVVVEGSGHDLMLDGGWPDVADRIDDWARAAVTTSAGPHGGNVP